jgi:hypothetical protein
LVELRGRHPDPQRVRETLDALGVALPIERGDRAELAATFRSAHAPALLLTIE